MAFGQLFPFADDIKEEAKYQTFSLFKNLKRRNLLQFKPICSNFCLFLNIHVRIIHERKHKFNRIILLRLKGSDLKSHF